MAADLVTIAKPFVKNDHNGPCAWRVADSGSVLRLLRRAIKCAYTPPWGPTLLALPMDVLEEQTVSRWDVYTDDVNASSLPMLGPSPARLRLCG